MAYICYKPAGSCRDCEHYRFDEDYGAPACFARVDLANSQQKTADTNKPATDKK